MADDPAAQAVSARLARLLHFLDQDPDNATLLAEVAETALTENRPELARKALAHRASRIAPSANLLNLAGVAAMRENDFAGAASIFEGLLQTTPSAPSVRFNLAWSWAMLKNLRGALGLLDPQTTDALPQAATLHLQLLHDQGQFDEAAAAARVHMARHPLHSGLLAAVSILALDIEDEALAKDCAERAGGQPDALITLGTLALRDDDAQALALFNSALQKNSRAPRAWIGKGLAELAGGANADAARDIQHGAELFQEHVGSWIAAGWAHLLASDLPASHASFQTALALDHNFSEAHGSLAVLSIYEGKVEEARKLAETALRLDPRSFSGTLAKALLLQSDGNHASASTLVQRALHTPIDGSGRTIAMAMAKYGMSA